MEEADFIISSAAELVTLAGPNRPRVKKEMDDLGIVRDGGVAVKGGEIVAVGKTEELLADYRGKIIDAAGKLVMPGFIDDHVHLVFAGSREDELELMIKGVTYPELKKRGKGMQVTLARTGEASDEELEAQNTRILDCMLLHGTTTIEAKSGYEMTPKGEIRQLEIINRLNERHPIDLIPTFCAQTIPASNEPDEFVDLVIDEMIPPIAKRKLARYCDVYREDIEGYFTEEQARRILEAGREHGMDLRIHADWLTPSGGAELAAELDVVTADHLVFSSDKGLDQMADKGVIGVLLPTSPFCYLGRYARAKEIIEKGVPVAIGTDISAINMCESMQVMIALACLQMHMTPAQAITASTINAAYGINEGHEVGSIEVGKKADLVIFDAPNHKFFPFHYGINLVDKVFKNGKMMVENGALIRQEET